MTEWLIFIGDFIEICIIGDFIIQLDPNYSYSVKLPVNYTYAIDTQNMWYLYDKATDNIQLNFDNITDLIAFVIKRADTFRPSHQNSAWNTF